MSRERHRVTWRTHSRPKPSSSARRRRRRRSSLSLEGRLCTHTRSVGRSDAECGRGRSSCSRAFLSGGRRFLLVITVHSVFLSSLYLYWCCIADRPGMNKDYLFDIYILIDGRDGNGRSNRTSGADRHSSGSLRLPPLRLAFPALITNSRVCWHRERS